MNYINRLLRKSGGASNKPSGGGTGNEEDLKKAASLESTDKLSQNSLPSTPTRSVADTDTTTDYESADEGQAGIDITQLSRDLEKIHLSTPKSFPLQLPEGRLQKFPSSPLENTNLSSPESYDSNTTWASVIDKTPYKSTYFNSTNLNTTDVFLSEEESPKSLSPVDFQNVFDVKREPDRLSSASNQKNPEFVPFAKSDQDLKVDDIENKLEYNSTNENLNQVDISSVALLSTGPTEQQKSLNELDLFNVALSPRDVEYISQQPNSVNFSPNKTEYEEHNSDIKQSCAWEDVPLDVLPVEESSADRRFSLNLSDEQYSIGTSNIPGNEPEINEVPKLVECSSDITGSYISDLTETTLKTAENHTAKTSDKVIGKILENDETNVKISDNASDLNNTESKGSEFFNLEHEALSVHSEKSYEPSSSVDAGEEINKPKVPDNNCNEHTFVSDEIRHLSEVEDDLDVLSNKSNAEINVNYLNEFEKETVLTDVTTLENQESSGKVEESNVESAKNLSPSETLQQENKSNVSNILNSENEQQNVITFNIDSNQEVLINQNFSEILSEEKLNLDENSEIFDLKQQNKFISTESSAVGAPLSVPVLETATNLSSNVCKTDEVSFDNLPASFDQVPLSPIVKTESKEILLKNTLNISPDENGTCAARNTPIDYLPCEFSPLNVSSASEKELQENIETCSALLLEEISDTDKNSVRYTNPHNTPLDESNNCKDNTTPTVIPSANTTCEFATQGQTLLHETGGLNGYTLDTCTEKLESLNDVINKSIPELLSLSKLSVVSDESIHSVSDEVNSSPSQLIDISNKNLEKKTGLLDANVIEDTLESFEQIESGNDLLEKVTGEEILEKDIKIGRTIVHSNLDSLLKADEEIETYKCVGSSAKECESFQTEESNLTDVICNEVSTVNQPTVTELSEIKEKLEEVRNATDDIIVNSKSDNLLSDKLEFRGSLEVKSDKDNRDILYVDDNLSKLSDTVQTNICSIDEISACKGSRISLNPCDGNQIEELKTEDIVSSSSGFSVESVRIVDSEEQSVASSVNNIDHKIEAPSLKALDIEINATNKDLKIDSDELSVDFEKLNIKEKKEVVEQEEAISNCHLGNPSIKLELNCDTDVKQLSSDSFSGGISELEESLKDKPKVSSTLNTPEIAKDGTIKKDLFNCSVSSVTSVSKSSPLSPFHDSSFLVNTSLSKELVKDQLNRSYRDLTELIATCSKQERELAENQVLESLEISQLNHAKEEEGSLITKQDCNEFVNRVIGTPELLLENNQNENVLLLKPECDVDGNKVINTEAKSKEIFNEEPIVSLNRELETAENKTSETYEVLQKNEVDIVTKQKKGIIDSKTVITSEKIQETFRGTSPKLENEIGTISASSDKNQYIPKEDINVISIAQEYDAVGNQLLVETPKKIQESDKKEFSSVSEEIEKLKQAKEEETSKKTIQEQKLITSNFNITPEKIQESFKENVEISKGESENIETKNTFVTPEKFQVNFKEEASIISQTLMAEAFDEQHMMQPPPSADINNSEAGPITADEDFHKGEFFQEATAVDFNLTPARLAPSLTRQSLYIRFDPLIEAALAAQGGGGDQESRDNTYTQNTINSTMADTKIGEGGDVEKSPKKDRNRSDLKESQQLIMINTPGKTSDLSGSEKLNNSSPGTPSNTAKRTLGSGGTPSLRQEVSKLQDLMLEQEQAYVEQLAEKNIMIETLRKRNSELEAKEPRGDLEDRLKARELEAAKLRKELNENNVSNKQLIIVMEEYEKAIASSVRRREDEKNEFEKIKEKIANERDTALQHLSNMEVAFNDIHLKYERCKSLIETLHSNEKQLKQTIEEQDRVIEQQKQNYAKLKQHATEKVHEANQEIATAHKSYQAEIAKMKAVSKKAELRVKSLEESLEQKKKEIKELTQICDELIGKVSGQ